jgi:Ca2+-transporting ATPase
VFTSLVLINMGLILVNRSFESSLIRALLQPNRALWILLGGVSSLLAVAVYWPPAQSLFHFGTLHWNDLAVCLAVGAISLLGLEFLKSRLFKATLVDTAGATPI